LRVTALPGFLGTQLPLNRRQQGQEFATQGRMVSIKSALLFSVSLLASNFAFAQTTISTVRTPIVRNLRHDVVMNGFFAQANSEITRFTVALEALNSEGKVLGTCTGIAIANDMILTAGHCFSTLAVKVNVLFGIGGKAGFTHNFITQDFVTLQTPKPPSTGQLWVDGKLPFDEAAQVAYTNDVVQRVQFKDYSELADNAAADMVKDPGFVDLAVIKIPSLPVGYAPIEFYDGDLQFNQTVYAMGYGTNSRLNSELFRALRYSDLKLVGYFNSSTDHRLLGLQTFSPTNQQACFGDSGGPLVVKDPRDNRLKVVGVNLFTFNKCANANWYLHVQYYMDWINAKIAELRSISKV
jgi:Trypsin